MSEAEQTIEPEAGPGPEKPHAEPQDREARRVEIGGLERALVMGDLSDLTDKEREAYYLRVCQSVGLNPLTRPFEYTRLQGPGGDRLVLYARRDCTDQLRATRGVSIEILSRDVVSDSSGRTSYEVLARAIDNTGRRDEALGAVALCREDGEWQTSSNGKRYWKGTGQWVDLTPDAAANAKMKAETKAKRRVTLSLCGLGFLDETEVADAIDVTPAPAAASGPAVLRSQPETLRRLHGELARVGLPLPRVLEKFHLLELGDLPLARVATLEARIADFAASSPSGPTPNGEKKP